ncbi:monosaccharide ABC transporter substrate-binding protein, CUT2 family [Arboricoccus pini]|uniref:Monosaccharide ABC transporter substrate-binding protein, CUT2 family n=1 Tax=Arboricoccus pini TaxID=1963835 RepID=A0A212RGI2_9PROT|nr:substrate-binding domain-containing protein [Arboricoccus pini]SNB71432.1 monosaccharide ABC transporter substrate-binding protein, CUT2 family [Arboricoccus pini]
MSIHRRTFFVLIGAATLSLAQAVPTLAAEAPTFALVQINQQALFFNQVNAGAEAAAKKAGANLVIYNANNDPASQNNAIETYIEQKVQGIIVDAIDVNGIMPAVQEAAKAGIPVISVDAVLPPGPQKAQVGVDNGKAGADMAEFLEKSIPAGGKLGIVGALNSAIQNLRQKGFEDRLKASDKFPIVNIVDGRNIQDNAMSAAENLLTGNPDLAVVYATGEPAMVGTVAAVESQGRQDSVKVVGWDLTAESIKGIDAGYVLGVVQQDPAAMGAAAIEALMKLHAGKTVDKEINVPVTIVTKSNVDPYRAVFK